jgi:hypothetical protein
MDGNAIRKALKDMVWQFAYRSNDDKRKWLCTDGLSALEHAFAALGWGDPYYIEQFQNHGQPF